MNEKKDGKLRLGKFTVQNLGKPLDTGDLQKINGGSNTNSPGTTDLAIFC
jgi:hypothetical protein